MHENDLFSHFANIREAEDAKERVNVVAGFEIWKQQAGAKQVLRHCYRRAAYYYERDYRRHGLPVSAKLIWEEVRQQIKRGQLRMKRRGGELKKWGGYRLNNNFTPELARHILNHKPQWNGLFELRERKED